MPAVNRAVDPKKKPKKRRGKIRLKPRKLNLKGCFKGPEDWDKFEDWVAIKGLPRTLPPPEPVNRGPSALLRELKRYKRLALPKIDPVPPECRCLVRTISKSTLKVRASRRTRHLATPKCRDDAHCVQRCINPAALKYKASLLIQCLAVPKERDDPPCLQLPRPVSKCALAREPTPKDCWLAIPKIFCPDFAREDCERGKRKPRELTPWVEFLSIPNYRVLKELQTDKGKAWRKRFPTESNERGKQALEEWLKTPRPEEEEPVDEAKQCWSYVKCLRKQLCIKDERLCNREEEERRAERMKHYEKQRRKVDAGKVGEAENVEKAEKADEADDECEESEGDRSGKKRSRKKRRTKKRRRLVFPEEDEESKEKRMKEKNHWRYERVVCKELPAPVSKGALKYEATPDTKRMATPKKFAAPLCDSDRLGKVKKGALNATASPRVEELAQPKHTSEPVKRDPPRERDEYDRVVLPSPEFGKKLPKVKKYKTKLKCDGDEDEDEDEGEESSASVKAKVKRPINPVAYGPTIDPVFDPVGACRQLKERRRAGLLGKECEEPDDEDECEEDEENSCTRRSRSRREEKDACSKKGSDLDTDEGDFASTLASRSGNRSVADEAVHADFED